jgi:hypothetical protein
MAPVSATTERRIEERTLRYISGHFLKVVEGLLGELGVQRDHSWWFSAEFINRVEEEIKAHPEWTIRECAIVFDNNVVSAVRQGYSAGGPEPRVAEQDQIALRSYISGFLNALKEGLEFDVAFELESVGVSSSEAEAFAAQQAQVSADHISSINWTIADVSRYIDCIVSDTVSNTCSDEASPIYHMLAPDPELLRQRLQCVEREQEEKPSPPPASTVNLPPESADVPWQQHETEQLLRQIYSSDMDQQDEMTWQDFLHRSNLQFEDMTISEPTDTIRLPPSTADTTTL